MELRSKKIPYIFTGGTSSDGYLASAGFSRMTNFTEFSVSKNAKEHTSKYIDEDFERSEVVGYAPSASYKFDYEHGNLGHEVLVNISDKELTGNEAKVMIAIVDMTRNSVASNVDGVYPCKLREFSVVPSSEGDDSDIYTYSGTLKAIGATEDGYMQILENGNGTYMREL